MAFQLPAIQTSVPIVDPTTGMQTAYYADWLNRVLRQITDQINTDSALLVNLQNTQAQLLSALQQIQAVSSATAVAQTTASGAAGPGSPQGGFASAVILVGFGWTNGPVVSLAGVSAGNLTFLGTGPTQGPDTVVSATDATGDWRIQEIIGAVETTVFTGQFFASLIQNSDFSYTSILYNVTDTTSAYVPRATTGAMDYRLDLQFTDASIANNVVANLYILRS